MRAPFPLPDTDWEPTRPFWAGAARHNLVIPRCDGCGRLRWYPQAECRYCGAGPMQWVPVSGRATLFSWVVVIHPFLPQFAAKVPFVSALVALDEDRSVRLATEIVDATPDQLAFEMPLEVTFRPISFPGVEGSVVAPLFRPAG